MTPFGKLLRRIRTTRGLSQRHLAELSGLHTLTITRIESSSAWEPHQSTLLAIAKGLNSSEFPLQGKELEEFVDVSGLTALLWQSGTFFEGEKGPMSVQAAFYAQLTEPEAALVRRVLQLAQDMGPELTAKILDTVATLALTARPSQPRTLSVHSPAKPGPAGSVERVITDYEDRSPAQQPAKRKAAQRRA